MIFLLTQKRYCAYGAAIFYSPSTLAKRIPLGKSRISLRSNITRRRRIELKKALASASAFFWWERVDSDHRSQRQQIYSLPPLATRERSHIRLSRGRVDGAGGRIRTPDLLITNQLLYRLSYTSGFLTRLRYYSMRRGVCQYHFSKKLCNLKFAQFCRKIAWENRFFVVFVKDGKMIPIDARAGTMYNDCRKTYTKGEPK